MKDDKEDIIKNDVTAPSNEFLKDSSDEKVSPTPTQNGRRAMLARWWDDQWRFPRPLDSLLCLFLSLFLAFIMFTSYSLAAPCGALVPAIAATAKRAASSRRPQAAIPFFTFIWRHAYQILALLLLKAFSITVMRTLIAVHSDLRRQYYLDRCWRHFPVEAGCLLLVPFLILRGPHAGWQADDLLFLAYRTDLFFWAGYWIEWWSGLSRLATKHLRNPPVPRFQDPDSGLYLIEMARILLTDE
ncbi:hypothetical protein PG984_006653 [Apiospora sp. TS-2023a]